MITASDGSVDVYREPFGIRTVTVTNTQLFINNQPFYCKGVAKHEDSDVSQFYAFQHYRKIVKFNA